MTTRPRTESFATGFGPGPAADQQGLRAHLGAYSVSVLGLAALLPASGRLLPERLVVLPARTVRALAARIGAQVSAVPAESDAPRRPSGQR